MREFARRTAVDRAAYFSEAAANRGVPDWMFEKDFWVCWLLQEIFQIDSLRHQLVFKGGTSLSKVYGVIQRFSEDIDLSVSPEYVGFTEAYLDDAPNKRQRELRIKEVETGCINAVHDRFLPLLTDAISAELGASDEGSWNILFQVDQASHSPVLLFRYPAGAVYNSYVRPEVKLEFGSLTDQRPIGEHSVTPMVAAEYPKIFAVTKAQVVALDVERTFWEKATILHAQFHRPSASHIPDRYSRHYSDMAALIRHPLGAQCRSRLDLLAQVVKHKSTFFSSGWANYHSAVAGTLRLVPPDYRLDRLHADYRLMQDMFLEPPAAFEEILTTLKRMEDDLNRT